MGSAPTEGNSTGLPSPASASPLELFLALVRIASPSGQEATLAGVIGDWLRQAGIPYEVDDSAELTGSDTGNLIVRPAAVRAGVPTVLMVAHLDTVQPLGSQIVPQLSDGVVRSQGDTILGADNKAGVAALLSLLVRPRDEQQANLVAVFSTCEEQGRMGVSALRELAGEADLVFPVDGSYPVGTVFEAALGHLPFRLQVRGRAAHAARTPEQGVHALQVAGRILAEASLGWQGNALLNISQATSDCPTNIIPDFVELHGEARAYSDAAIVARLRELEGQARAIAQQNDAEVELAIDSVHGTPAFPTRPGNTCLAIAERAAAQAGVALRRERCQATLEANFLHSFGVPTLGIASGGQHPHAFYECLPAVELQRLVALLEAVLRCAVE